MRRGSYGRSAAGKHPRRGRPRRLAQELACFHVVSPLTSTSGCRPPQGPPQALACSFKTGPLTAPVAAAPWCFPASRNPYDKPLRPHFQQPIRHGARLHVVALTHRAAQPKHARSPLSPCSAANRPPSVGGGGSPPQPCVGASCQATRPARKNGHGVSAAATVRKWPRCWIRFLTPRAGRLRRFLPRTPAITPSESRTIVSSR